MSVAGKDIQGPSVSSKNDYGKWTLESLAGNEYDEVAPGDLFNVQ